jgi:hypothetical protein
MRVFIPFVVILVLCSVFVWASEQRVEVRIDRVSEESIDLHAIYYNIGEDTLSFWGFPCSGQFIMPRLGSNREPEEWPTYLVKILWPDTLIWKDLLTSESACDSSVLGWVMPPKSRVTIGMRVIPTSEHDFSYFCQPCSVDVMVVSYRWGSSKDRCSGAYNRWERSGWDYEPEHWLLTSPRVVLWVPSTWE